MVTMWSIPSTLILLSVVAWTQAASAVGTRAQQVNRAIEQTKSRQAPAAAPMRVPTRQGQNNNGGRSETLDVDKLNKLIRSLDKTWIMPRAGAKEPVGSNFQYKKTCASIYKARHGACQQVSFGTMCFNYCAERGEKLAFKCVDNSDAAYCKESGKFEVYLAKYSKDGYKAKAYIHQMISRCYATAICNTQTGILNSTQIEEVEEEAVQATTKPSRLRLTRPPGGLIRPDAKDGKKRASPRSRLEETTTPVPATSTKANIWDKFTVNNKAKPTPKNIPFWQKLMTSTPSGGMTSTEEEENETPGPESPAPASADEDEEDEEEEEEEEEETTPAPTTTTTRKPKSKKKKAKLVAAAAPPSSPEPVHSTTPTTPSPPATSESVEQSEEETTVTESATPAPKATFAPLKPQQPADAQFQKPSGMEEPGFWNRFQPGRWYQSVHYITNTGR